MLNFHLTCSPWDPSHKPGWTPLTAVPLVVKVLVNYWCYFLKIIFCSFYKSGSCGGNASYTWPLPIRHVPPSEKWLRTSVQVEGPYVTGREKWELPTAAGARTRLLPTILSPKFLPLDQSRVSALRWLPIPSPGEIPHAQPYHGSYLCIGQVLPQCYVTIHPQNSYHLFSGISGLATEALLPTVGLWA